MMKTKRIGVVMGGPSKEREVSLNTGSAIVEALKEKGYDAVPIDLDPSLFPSQIEDAGVKVVFNAVHGLYGRWKAAGRPRNAWRSLHRVGRSFKRHCHE